MSARTPPDMHCELLGSSGGGSPTTPANGLELTPPLSDLLGWRDETAPPIGLPRDASRALPPRQRGRFTIKSVIGDDDRQRVTDAERYPWRAICYLEITAADGESFVGTGFLAGPNLVLTAGHCVFMHAHGGWVRRLVVTLGINGPGSTPAHEPVVAVTVRSVEGWQLGKHDAHDYGAVYLDPGLNVGEKIGYFGFRRVDDGTLANTSLNLAGYPADREPQTMWWQANRSANAADTTFEYTIDTYEGQSGAPVWHAVEGRREVLGVHFGGGTDRNYAVRVTPSLIETVATWRSESA